VFAPPNIILSVLVARDFGELEFRIAGASAHLQRKSFSEIEYLLYLYPEEYFKWTCPVSIFWTNSNFWW
jgi:hypothetical protein